MTTRKGELGIAALVALVATLLLYLPPFWAADLGPLPDAGEYAFAARALAHLEPYALSLYGADYPPRYPFGFSALIAPAYWLPHRGLATGIYGVLAFGVLATLLVYALARRLAGRVAGVAAAALLLLSPQYLLWNHQVMSETATIAIVAALALLVHGVAKETPACLAGARERGQGPGVPTSVQSCCTYGAVRRRRLFLVSLGVVAGIALVVRLANIVVLVALVLALIADRRLRADGPRAMLALGAGPALALAALAASAQHTFGSPAGTGYRYWVPYWYASLGRTFAPRYAVAAPGIAGDSFAPTDIPNLAYYARGFADQLPLHSLASLTPWFAALALVGGLVLARDRALPTRMVCIFAGVFAGLTVALYALYFFQSVRFMAPLLPLLAVAGGVAVGRGIRWLRAGVRGKRMHGIAAGGTLCAVALIGVVSVAAPTLDGCYLYRWYVRQDRAPYPTPVDGRTAALYQAVVPAGGLIVTDVFPLILAGTPVVDRATVIPLSRREYLSKPPLEQTPTFLRREREVKDALRDGVPVFTDNYTVDFLAARQRPDRTHREIAAYGRTPVAESSGLVIYRLSPGAVALDAATPLDPLLTATPTVTAPGATFGETTIVWDTGDGSMGQLSVSYDGGPDALVDEGASGEHPAPWIRRGSTYTFTLYAGTARRVELLRVIVVGT